MSFVYLNTNTEMVVNTDRADSQKEALVISLAIDVA
jgi:hypothetical protein